MKTERDCENFHSLVEYHASLGEDMNIAVGLRPSGLIHLGNMATMALAGVLGRKIGPHLSNVVVTVCDLDLPDRSDWPLREKGFLRYFKDLPAPENSGERSLLEHAQNRIESYAEDLGQVLGVGFEVQRLSDVQRDPRYREGLKKVLDNPDFTGLVFHSDQSSSRNNSGHQINGGAVPVFPLCGECGTSSGYAAQYSNGVLRSSCTNPSCETKDYELDVLDTGRDLAVHFLVDPIRDVTVPPTIDVHVFGGDYRDQHNHSGLTRLNKVRRIIKMASDETPDPDFLVGPIFYGVNGTKMSKSSHNGLTHERLVNYFGQKEYASKIADLMESTAKEGLRHVDSTFWNGVLFG